LINSVKVKIKYYLIARINEKGERHPDVSLSKGGVIGEEILQFTRTIAIKYLEHELHSSFTSSIITTLFEQLLVSLIAVIFWEPATIAIV
jgi:hypothetical protein